MAINRGNILEYSLLELLSYVPVVLILGNILPPISGIKIHWIYIGFVFLNSLALLGKSKRATGLLIIILFFGLIQVFLSIRFSIIEFVDFISGPLLLVSVVNIIIAEKLEEHSLKYFRRKLLLSFAIPVMIGIFQYVGLLPLEFLNAKYVNATQFGTEVIERVNGFLYHGIELAIIILFFFINTSVFMKSIVTYIALSVMVLLEFTTLIKTGIITGILFIIHYSYFIDSKVRSIKLIVIGLIILFGFSYLFILIPDLKADRFHFNTEHFEFEDQLFTGRGFIWNTYLRGVRDFNVGQILIGAGFGSGSTIFEKNAFGNQTWIPGPHNQFLDLFVNGGLFAIGLVMFILFKQYYKLRHCFTKNRTIFHRYYWGVILIPLLVMGITAPIMSMFIYWCGLCLTILSLRLKLLNSAK